MRDYENRVKKLEKRILPPENRIVMVVTLAGYKGPKEDDELDKCHQYREQLKKQKGRTIQLLILDCRNCDGGCGQNM